MWVGPVSIMIIPLSRSASVTSPNRPSRVPQQFCKKIDPSTTIQVFSYAIAVNHRSGCNPLHRAGTRED
ncbi:hypothetical protein BDW75DRAFT_187892 [Aspergillus navahoensis]